MGNKFINRLKNKDPGFSVISLCLICIMIIVLIASFSLKMKMYYNSKTFVDDAITNANLSAATIDGYGYGLTGSITNFDYDNMYKEYLKTLSHDLNADVVDGDLGVTLTPKNNIHFDSNINILKFYVYNKTADGEITLAKVVDSVDENKGTHGVYYGASLEKPIDESKAITPDGTYMEDDYSCMMIYSQISYDLNGVFGNSEFYGSTETPMYRVKEHSVDVITTHGYKEIDRLEPTCIDDGYIIYQCTNDDCINGYRHEYTLILEKLGHNYLEAYTYEDNNGVTNGYRYRECTRCDSITGEQYRVYITKNDYIEAFTGDGYYNPGATVTIRCVTKEGSEFTGWTGTFSFMDKETTFTMPEHAVALTVGSKTSYTVRHWQQTLTGGDEQNSTNYTLVETESLETTELTVTPAVKDYSGFTPPTTQNVTLASDGSTIVDYYYTRNSYAVTLTKGAGIDTVTGAGTYKYGASVTINATLSSGYKWSKWTGYKTTTTQEYTFEMPATEVNFTANAIRSFIFNKKYVSGGITSMTKQSGAGSLGKYSYSEGNYMLITSGWTAGQSLGNITLKSNSIKCASTDTKLYYKIAIWQDLQTTKNQVCKISFGGVSKSFSPTSTTQTITGYLDVSSLNGSYVFQVDLDCGIYNTPVYNSPGYANSKMYIYQLWFE